jgi:hypothetical protein
MDIGTLVLSDGEKDGSGGAPLDHGRMRFDKFAGFCAGK